MEYLADVYRYGKLGQRENPKLAESWQKKADAMLEKEKAAQTVLPLPQGSPSPPPAPSRHDRRTGKRKNRRAGRQIRRRLAQISLGTQNGNITDSSLPAEENRPRYPPNQAQGFPVFSCLNGKRRLPYRQVHPEKCAFPAGLRKEPAFSGKERHHVSRQ